MTTRSSATLIFLMLVTVACSDAPSESPRPTQAVPEGSPSGDMNIDTVPNWYVGSKPWMDISKSGRRDIVSMRSGFEETKAVAEEPATKNSPDPVHVKAGKDLINAILIKHRVDSFYRNPSRFGSRMVIWLPSAAWASLSDEEHDSIEAYMSSRYTNWGIGVGRVKGRDILSDRLVVKH